ncbi:MAG TPA: hypothetical protein VE291_02940 [Terracidiphilus sp.]|jgi:hypothetical protein|nr:hypothetical protein [Terracidiphilus sp.]
MSTTSIGKQNVGRIAERVVANELEFRGYRVSDLNKDGISPNVDLLAVKDGIPWQIQVKGASYSGWWVNYGVCDQEIINGSRRMFNRANSPLRAQIVVLVCVKSPKDYRCVVLPVNAAEDAAQLNLDYAYREPNKDGSAKVPNKVYVNLRYVPNTKDAKRKMRMMKEQEFINRFIDDEQNAGADLWDFDVLTKGFAGVQQKIE